MQQQKDRSRAATAIDTEDWIVVNEDVALSEFVGYDSTEIKTKIAKYRKVKTKGKEHYRLYWKQHLFMLKAADRLVIPAN